MKNAKQEEMPLFQTPGFDYDDKDQKLIPTTITVKLPKSKKKDSTPGQTLPGQGSTSDFGKPVTQNAAYKLIKKRLDDIKFKCSKIREAVEYDKMTQDKKVKLDAELYNLALQFQAQGIIFSKDIQLFLLAQPGCAGIKYFVCANPDATAERKDSLVLIGVDEEGCENLIEDTNCNIVIPEGKTPLAEQRAVIYEVGGPYVKRYADVLDDPAIRIGSFADLIKSVLGDIKQGK